MATINVDQLPSLPELRALLRDPRYWRDGEPALVQRVEHGLIGLLDVHTLRALRLRTERAEGHG